MWLIATLLLITSLIVLISHFVFPALPSFFYQTITLLLLGTVGIYFYLADVKKHRPDYFIPLYIATISVKILAYGAYVLFMVWDDKSQAIENALLFIITYFVFTGIEITFLYRKVSR